MILGLVFVSDPAIAQAGAQRDKQQRQPETSLAARVWCCAQVRIQCVSGYWALLGRDRDVNTILAWAKLKGRL